MGKTFVDSDKGRTVGLYKVSQTYRDSIIMCFIAFGGEDLRGHTDSYGSFVGRPMKIEICNQ